MGMPWKLKAILWLNNTFNKLDLKTASVASVRNFADNRESSLTDGPPIQLRNVEDKQITGRNGAIPVRIYLPQQKENLPVIVFYHGGGFVIGNLKSHDKVCRRTCKSFSTRT